MKTKVTIIILLVFIMFSTWIFSPYLRSEVLTLHYGDEFKGLEQQTRMLNPAKYYKVISYNNTEATIFYVSDTSGDLIKFIKNINNAWEIKEWYTIWSSSGSADSFFWPYYR